MLVETYASPSDRSGNATISREIVISALREWDG